MSELDPSHELEPLWGTKQVCSRCLMCECHSMHKLIIECERIDGRKKDSNDD